MTTCDVVAWPSGPRSSLDSACQSTLATFRRQYMQRIPVNEIDFPGPRLLMQWNLQEWIWSFIDDFRMNNPYPEHDKLFLKHLQLKIEESVEGAEEPDILDSFAEFYGRLLRQGDQTDEHVWVRYVPPWNKTDLDSSEVGIDILERPGILSAAGCTGHKTWDAAICLASVLGTADFSSRIRDQNVLEIGSGTGLLSFTCALLGAKQVLATDADGSALSRIDQIAARNAWAKEKVHQQQFVWGEDLSALQMQQADVLLAADVAYDSSNHEDLVQTLRDAVDLWPEAWVVMAVTVRNPETMIAFKQLSESRGLVLKPLIQHEPGGDAPHLASGLFHSVKMPIRIIQVATGRPG